MALSVERAIAEIITTKWNATAQLGTDCAGGIHYELYQAPSDGSATTRPYCVFDMQPGGQEIQSTGGDRIVDRNVRFKVFGKQSEVHVAIATIEATFHRATLANPTGWIFLKCVIAPGGNAQVEMWQRDGEQVWQAVVVMQVMLAASF